MQQTEKLNLNLIEGSDPVDWEVLNDNFKSLDKTVSTVSVLSQATADFIGSAKNCCIAFGS